MRNENAYLTEYMAERRVQQSWNAFCESCSVPAYLAYRSCRDELEGRTDADTSDRQGTGHP